MHLRLGTVNRPLPSMALDFLTEPVLSSTVTFARSSAATRVGQDGLIQTVAVDAPRFDFDPVSRSPRGLLIEEARTNLLVNSPVSGVVLPTQSVSVTAVPHTISFYGTGTITLSGAAVASVVGTGAYPNRRVLTFTPILGVLVCTVVGLVQFAQLEVGSFATSFIPTAASPVARSADIATMTGTNFSSWYNQSEGTFVVGASQPAVTGVTSRVLSANDGTTNESVQMATTATSAVGYAEIRDGAVAVVSITNGTITVGAVAQMAFAFAANNASLVTNGATPTTDTSLTMPTVDRLNIGSNAAGANLWNGHIRQIAYYNRRLPDIQLQALSA